MLPQFFTRSTIIVKPQSRLPFILALVLFFILSIPLLVNAGHCGVSSFSKACESLEQLSRNPKAGRDQWIKVIQTFLAIHRSSKEQGIAKKSLFLAGRASLMLYRRSGRSNDVDRAIRCLYEYTRTTRQGPRRILGLEELKTAHLLKRKLRNNPRSRAAPTSASKTIRCDAHPTSLDPNNRPLEACPDLRDQGLSRWASAAKAPPDRPPNRWIGNPFCSGEATPPVARGQSHSAGPAKPIFSRVGLLPQRLVKENASSPPKALSPPIPNESVARPKLASVRPGATSDAAPMVRQIENCPRKFVIVLDPGHGGKDPGAVSKDGRTKEKDITLEVANLLKKRLVSIAPLVKVEMTRTDDRFLTLQERTAMANSLNADLFISLHCNSDSDSSSRGVETFYLSKASSPRAMRMAARENGIPLAKMSDLQATLLDLMLTSRKRESDKLAKSVHNCLVKNLTKAAPKIRDRGIKRAPFYVLLGAKMPAILVECAFISNSREEHKLTSTKYLDRVALGIAKGASVYLRELGGKS